MSATATDRIEVRVPVQYSMGVLRPKAEMDKGGEATAGPSPASSPQPSAATMYTRENLTVLFHCSHGELGRLLARKMAPLPVRIDGQILWHADEVKEATPQVLRTLERWKKRR